MTPTNETFVHAGSDSRATPDRSTSMLEATLEATSDGILAIDADHRIAFVNERFYQMWRLARPIDSEEVLTREVASRLLHPEAYLSLKQAQREQPELEQRDVLALKDGRYIERLSRPRYVGSRFAGWVSSSRDISERERLFQRANFVSDASRLLASLDIDDALRALSALAVPFLGACCAIDVLDQPGRPYSRFSSGTAKGLTLGPLPPALLAGHSVIKTSEGTSLLSVPLKAAGTVVGAITFASAAERRYSSFEADIAEELAVRASLAIERALAHADTQRAAEARESFLSNAAHELRSPLTSMRLAIEALRRGSRDRIQTFVDMNERDERRLLRFVQQIDDYSSILLGRLRFTLATVDLAAVASEALYQLQEELDRSGSKLVIRAEGAVVGTWDRARVMQIAVSLLSNAIKFGLGNPIEVRVTAADGVARLVVQDNGIGVPAELRPQLFEPFGRMASTGVHYGGLGLGLFIARKLARALGGDVELEPTLGGSVFVAKLPQ